MHTLEKPKPDFEGQEIIGAKVFSKIEGREHQAGFYCSRCEVFHWHGCENLSFKESSGSRCPHCHTTETIPDYYLWITGEAEEEDYKLYERVEINEEIINASSWFYPLFTYDDVDNKNFLDEEKKKDIQKGKDMLNKISKGDDVVFEDLMKLSKYYFFNGFCDKSLDWKDNLRKNEEIWEGNEEQLNFFKIIQKRDIQYEDAIKECNGIIDKNKIKIISNRFSELDENVIEADIIRTTKDQNIPEEKSNNMTFEYPSEEELEGFNESTNKQILQDISKNPEALKSVSLKNVQVIGNKIIKASFLIDTYEKSVNLIKGWECVCPQCQKKSTLYNPRIKGSLDFCGCEDSGLRGAVKSFPLEVKRLNDTGFYCDASDLNDKSSNQSSYKIFFGLEMLKKQKIDLDHFEELIFGNPVEIVGIIRVKQGKETNITDFFIDVQNFKVIEEQLNYDISKVNLLKSEPRDDAFFKKYYCPGVFGRSLAKKCESLMINCPHRIKLPSGRIMNSVINLFIAGDPGLAKTVLARKGFCNYTGSDFVSAGNSSKAGLIGGAQKGVSGRWTVSLGSIPKQHLKGIVIDELGKLSQEDLAEFRGIESENQLNMNKIGIRIKRDCIVHKITLGNLTRNVKDYTSKHQASRDLGVNEGDRSGKFSGADRRRKDFIIIEGNNDLKTYEVSKHLLTFEIDKNFDDFEYWNNKKNFAWSRKPEQIKWFEGVEEKVLDFTTALNQLYPTYELEYGILGKGGSDMFIKLLPAVALLHDSYDRDEKIVVLEEHCNWLFNLYKEMFDSLDLTGEQEKIKGYESLARKILHKTPEDVKEILFLLFKFGSSSAIERTGEYSRKTVYNKLKNCYPEIEAQTQNNEKIGIIYNFVDGSLMKQVGKSEYIQTKWLPSIQKDDGSFTDFGKILLKINSETKLNDVIILK